MVPEHYVTRVGFAPNLYGESWLGGVNYFRNLFSALNSLETRAIEPILLVRNQEAKAAAALKHCVSTIKVPDLLAPRGGWQEKAIASVRPLLWRKFLASQDIQVLSHSPPILPYKKFPSLGIIYDFQHKHLPSLFSSEDVRSRNRAIASLCRCSSRILVSSQAALEDLKVFFPDYAHKGRVLRFVADTSTGTPTSEEVLREKYQLPNRYAYLPNQFWKHKNHLTVLRSLYILRVSKRDLTIVASGATSDYRHPDYVADIMREVNALKLQASFRILGVVPYEDLLGLMRASVAVLNPSLFEGWSTTVEEAKSMGKMAIMSSIPVHIEQAPPRAMYFDPTSAEELADRLTTAVESFSPTDEKRWQEKACAELPSRMQRFALAYQDLVVEALQG